MILGIAEDFSTNTTLDSQLTSIPTSGLYLNSGTHPSITVENLLAFLPYISITFNDWSNTSNYNAFDDSRKRDDIVLYNDEIWQCIQSNVNQTPSEGQYWTKTDIDSLRIKSFIQRVKDKVYADLHLTRNLVNNQFLYENIDTDEDEIELSGDYSAWVFEAKGSDYVSIRINQIAFQKKSTTPVNLYVINQGVLHQTLTITPKNGALEFDDIDLVLSGKGKWILAIDSTSVLSQGANIDPLRFDGFVAYTGTGLGDSPESAKYSFNTSSIGVGLNVTAFYDGALYIKNNTKYLANFIRATFAYMVFEMFFHNSNNQSNRAQRIQMSDNVLISELKDKQADTIVSKYYKEKKKAISILNKTFDTQFDESDGIEITTSSF